MVYSFGSLTPSSLFLDAHSNLGGRQTIFVLRRKPGLTDAASWPRSQSWCKSQISAQVFFFTSYFLSREQYKMLLGSKCQMSRTDSCSA